MDGKISDNLTVNMNRIKSVLGNGIDFSTREFGLKIRKNYLKLAILYNSGLVDKNKINNLSLEINELIASDIFDGSSSLETCFNQLKGAILCESSISEGSDFETLYDDILSGNTIILIDGFNRFLILNTYGPDGRSINEPTSQTIVKGPKEAFTERINTNISLIRRRLKDKSLKVENMKLGSLTKTSIAILYMEGIAKEEILNEVRSRLNKIKMDGMLEGGYIEELISDDPYSVFPAILNSEKPDTVVAQLLEGKIAIVIDGSPYVLTVPALFAEFFQVSEDYYHNFWVSAMNRLLRYASFYLTLLMPSIYIALTTFHQEMIPTTLLISIASQREGVPFSAFSEALLMEVTFEILREAGIRMPRAIGPAISIVGALVLGQAAVQAGIVSAAMVIIVAITAIASFAIPNYSMSNAIRLLRFIFMILSATFGLYGIYMGMIVLVLHLSKLKSIGIPYLTPFAPRIPKNNKDTFIRFPIWKLNYRPKPAAQTQAPRNNMQTSVESGVKENQEFH